MQTASIVRENGNLSTLFFNCDDFFFRPIGKADTGFFRPISPVGLNTGSAFSPFCATSASASPRGRRERTSVRPLALGLASLNSHQTDENASLEGALFRLLGSIRAFGALFRYRSIRAFCRAMCSRALRAYARLGAPYWLCQYGRFKSAPKTAKDCQKAVDNISSRRSNDAFCALRSAFWANPTRHGATNK